MLFSDTNEGITFYYYFSLNHRLEEALISRWKCFRALTQTKNLKNTLNSPLELIKWLQIWLSLTLDHFHRIQWKKTKSSNKTFVARFNLYLRIYVLFWSFLVLKRTKYIPVLYLSAINIYIEINISRPRIPTLTWWRGLCVPVTLGAVLSWPIAPGRDSQVCPKLPRDSQLCLLHIPIITLVSHCSASKGDYLWKFSGHVQLVVDHEVDPEHPGGITSHLAWEHLRIPPEELESIAGERDIWTTLLSLQSLPAPDKRKKMDGWMDQ